jgi:peptide methionine sulfoxide reductase MsrB
MSNHQPDQRTDKLVKSDAGCRAELTPSFDRPASAPALSEHDRRFVFTRRPEVRRPCGDGHLGHAFRGGPRETTGFRPEDG